MPPAAARSNSSRTARRPSSPRGKSRSAGLSGGTALTKTLSAANPISDMVRNDSPFSARSSAMQSLTTLDDGSKSKRRIEAAANPDVQRQIVCLMRERPGASRRHGDHPDAGNEHVDAAREMSSSRREFRFGRTDEKNTHGLPPRKSEEEWTVRQTPLDSLYRPAG
jgi:hypothetical protein